jgi:hypothetical protein
MTMRKTALLASLLAFAACGDPDFNKPALLDKPRILAVKAEPPQPRFGATTTLSTLLYEPPAEHLKVGECVPAQAKSYKWSWCPISMIADAENNTYKCPFPEESFRQLYAGLQQAVPGLPDPPPYELGEGEMMTFPNPFPATLLYALCRGDIGSSLGGASGGSDPTSGKSVFSCDLPAADIAAASDNGVDLTNLLNTHPISFNITLKVEIAPTCPDLLPDGFGLLTALYTLHLPTDDNIPVNQNPVLSGIFAYTDNLVAYPDAGTSNPDEGVDAGVAPTDIDGGATPAVDGGIGGSPQSANHNGPDSSVPLEEQPLVEVKRDKHVGLALDIDINTAEFLPVPGRIDYVPVSKTQKEALTRHSEHLSFAWFGEAGDFTGRGKGRSTGYLPEAIPDTQPFTGPTDKDRSNFAFNTTNTWDLPKSEDYNPDAPNLSTARIIVVVRDGRGGVDWTTKQVTLEATP